MPHITMMRDSRRTDPTLRKKVLAFLEKLMDSDQLPGLHIEPMQNAHDPRARTGRVDDQFRAVLYRIEGEAEPHYVYAGTYNHDEAIRIAQTKILYVNPVSGVLELIAQQSEELISQETGKAEKARLTDHQVYETKAVEEEVSDLPEAITVEDDFENKLIINGHTAEILQQKIGIDPNLTNLARTARTHQEFNNAIDSGATWQGYVLLELQAGDSIEDVIEKLTLQIRAEEIPHPAEKTPSSDDAVIESFKEPATQAEFALIDDLDELKEIITNGSFDQWRTFLHPEQKKYVTINDTDNPQSLRSKGSFRISGGAGTGKTVVALHRTRCLYRRNKNARIILTTFNKTLTDVLHEQLNLLDDRIRIIDTLGQPGVLVKGPDAIASAIWSGASMLEKQAAVVAVLGEGRPVRHQATTHSKTDTYWKNAIDDADTKLSQELLYPNFLEEEYVNVVLGNFITTARAYLKVPRPGRGTALNRSQRLELWKIIEYYRNNNDLTEGYSYPERLCLAASILQKRAEQGSYIADHVIVDEGQDLSPAHWQLLRALVPESQDDLFIAEDSHQRIYGQRFPLSRFGINIRGRARRMRLNYRTTAENLSYAMRMLDPVKWQDLEDGEENHDYISARSGPQPQLMHFTNKPDEYDTLAALIRSWRAEDGNAAETAILVRTKKISQEVMQALDDRGIVAVQIENNPQNNKNVPHIMTMHRAKGMEYKRIILFEINDTSLPLPNATRNLPVGEKEDQKRRERSLLYVASTRARDELVIMWSGKKSSLLPEN